MITFHNIKYRNFMSFGNTPTEVALDQHEIVLTVGGNGCGKSSIQDAICFGLFGRAFRNINKPQLVNATNQKECEVELMFTSHGNRCRVVRGLKPTIFEIYINDELLDQSSKTKDYQEHFEKNILKMNFKTFTQVVILGAASYTPFMELTAANRRNVVEDLLDIQIFSTMNDLVKNKISTLKDEYNKNNYDITLKNEKISLMQKHIEDMKKSSAPNTQAIDDSIADSYTQLKEVESEIVVLKMTLESLDFLVAEQEKTLTNINTHLGYKKSITKNISSIKKDIEFYDSHENCPTCKQDIMDTHKHEIITEKNLKVNKFANAIQKIDTDIAALQKEYDEQHDKVGILLPKTKLLHDKETTEKVLKNTIVSLNKQKQTQLVSIKTPVINNNEDLIKAEQQQLVVLEQERRKILDAQNSHSIMATLLKDNGIKSTIIKQYLPVMNKLINKYLGDLDFFIDFNLTDNFSENIKSRNKYDFTYASFSEGEKFKINLALLFTWRELAKLRNSSATNLLFLDEVMDSSLDLWGTEAVLKLIHQLKRSNIFIISHKVDILQDKFQNILTVVKENGFSKIKK